MMAESSNHQFNEQAPSARQTDLETVEDISRLVQDLFAEIPDDEWDQIEPALLKWLNEKAGIDPQRAAQ